MTMVSYFYKIFLIYLYNLSKKEKENDLTHVSRRVLLLVRVVASASSI